MSKKEKTISALYFLVLVSLGFLSGSIYENGKKIEYSDTNTELKKEIILKNDSIDFWRKGYMKRNEALREISNHKDCTFELRKIIGGIH